MELSKELVLQAIPATSSERLAGLTDAQWAEYLRLLGEYSSGQWAPDGWQFLIESVMTQHGATPEQAFILAEARHNIPKAD